MQKLGTRDAYGVPRECKNSVGVAVVEGPGSAGTGLGVAPMGMEPLRAEGVQELG